MVVVDLDVSMQCDVKKNNDTIKFIYGNLLNIQVIKFINFIHLIKIRI